MTNTEPQWLDVGRVGRPHGVNGVVHVHVFNPASDLFDVGLQVLARMPGKPGRMLQVEDVRPVKSGVLLAFAGVADREAAGLLTHAVLAVDANALPPLPEDEFYLHEVVGAIVHEAETGLRVGVVTGIVATNTDLLTIRLDAGGEALVPVDSDAVESLGREPGKVVVRHVEDWRSL